MFSHLFAVVRSLFGKTLKDDRTTTEERLYNGSGEISFFLLVYKIILGTFRY